MIVLDTNVISELMQLEPSEMVFDWFNLYKPSSVYTTAITQSEILYGIEVLHEGKRKHHLKDRADYLFNVDFQARILPFTSKETHEYAKITANRKTIGRPISIPDAQIAAITIAHGATLATRNTKDFEECGIKLENPWGG